MDREQCSICDSPAHSVAAAETPTCTLWGHALWGQIAQFHRRPGCEPPWWSMQLELAEPWPSITRTTQWTYLDNFKFSLIYSPWVILACEASSFRSWGHVGVVKGSVRQARRIGLLKVLKYVVQRMGTVTCVSYFRLFSISPGNAEGQ